MQMFTLSMLWLIFISTVSSANSDRYREFTDTAVYSEFTVRLETIVTCGDAERNNFYPVKNRAKNWNHEDYSYTATLLVGPKPKKAGKRQITSICSVHNGDISEVSWCEGSWLIERGFEDFTITIENPPQCGCKSPPCVKKEKFNFTIVDENKKKDEHLFNGNMKIFFRWNTDEKYPSIHITHESDNVEINFVEPMFLGKNGLDTHVDIVFGEPEDFGKGMASDLMLCDPLDEQLTCQDLKISLSAKVAECPESSKLQKRNPFTLTIGNATHREFLCQSFVKLGGERVTCSSSLKAEHVSAVDRYLFITAYNMDECLKSSKQGLSLLENVTTIVIADKRKRKRTIFTSHIGIELEWSLKGLPGVNMKTQQDLYPYSYSDWAIFKGEARFIDGPFLSKEDFMKPNTKKVHVKFDPIRLQRRTTNQFQTDNPPPTPYEPQVTWARSKPNQQPGIKSTPPPNSLNPRPSTPVTLGETTRAPDDPDMNEPETTPGVEEDAVTELHDSEVDEPRADAQTSGDNPVEDSAASHHFGIFLILLVFF